MFGYFKILTYKCLSKNILNKFIGGS